MLKKSWFSKIFFMFNRSVTNKLLNRLCPHICWEKPAVKMNAVSLDLCQWKEEREEKNPPTQCIFCVYLGIDLAKFLSLCCLTQLLHHTTSPMMFHFGCAEITVLFYLNCHYGKDKDYNGKPEAFQHLEKRTKYHYSVLKDVSEESFISHLLWAGKHTLMLCKRQRQGLQFLKKQVGELKGCSPTKRCISV